LWESLTNVGDLILELMLVAQKFSQSSWARN